MPNVGLRCANPTYAYSFLVAEWNGTMLLPAQGSGPHQAAAFPDVLLERLESCGQGREGFLLRVIDFPLLLNSPL